MKNNAVLGYIPRTIKGYIAPIQKKVLHTHNYWATKDALYYGIHDDYGV